MNSRNASTVVRSAVIGMLPAIVGLAVAALLSVVLLGLLRVPRFLNEFFPRAWLIYTAAIFLAAGVAGGITFLGIPNAQRGAGWVVARRLAATGVWFAPMAGLLVRGSPWSAAVVVVIVAIVTTGCLRTFYWPARQSRLQAKARGALPSFALMPQITPLRRSYSLLIAGCLHVGALATLLSSPGLGAVAISIAVAVTTWQLSSPGGGYSWLKTLGSPCLAVLLLCVPTMTFQRHMQCSQGGGEANGTTVSPADAKKLHSGVILVTERKNHVLLVPVPPRLRSVPGTKQQMHIPFSGQYWFFYARADLEQRRRVSFLAQPPKNSMLDHGNPLTWNLTAMNPRMSLVMKAHQTLPEPVNTSCCSAIRVALEDADTELGTTWIELVLIDSTVPHPAGAGAGLVSLGEQPLRRGEARSTLTFPVPRPAITRFDTIEVIFHLDPSRRNQSANSAVDGFDFVAAN